MSSRCPCRTGQSARADSHGGLLIRKRLEPPCHPLPQMIQAGLVLELTEPLSSLRAEETVEHTLDIVDVAAVDVAAGLQVIAEDCRAGAAHYSELLAQIR